MADPNMSKSTGDRRSSNGTGVLPHDLASATMSSDDQPYEYTGSSYHEPGLSIDFTDPPEIVADEIKEISSDSETSLDTDSSNDFDNEGDSGSDKNHETITHNSPELGPTTEGLDTASGPSSPLAGALSQEPITFASLLNSPYAPNRGSFDIEVQLQNENAELKDLRTEKRRIKKLLKEAEQRYQATHEKLDTSMRAFQALQYQAGISEDLWEEYEAFCESLEPRFGSRGGWSITCFTDHQGSYLQYDPHLMIFLRTAEIPLHNCNFRCEASTVGPSAAQMALPNCPDKEYVVEFWPIASLEPRTGSETTWGEQYPDLYRLATRALYDLSRPDTQAASQLLHSLPDPKALFSGGWMFEYHAEGKRASHPVKSRRWTYRSAHKIDISVHHPDETLAEEEDPITDEDDAFAETDSREMTLTHMELLASTDSGEMLDLD